MTPVANTITAHIERRIRDHAGVENIRIMPVDSALPMSLHDPSLIRIEVVDDALDDSRTTLGLQGAVGMALEIDVVVLSKKNTESSEAARTIAADINQLLLSNFGNVDSDGFRYRIEHAGDESDTDGDTATEITAIRTQYSVLYRVRRDNPAIAA